MQIINNYECFVLLCCIFEMQFKFCQMRFLRHAHSAARTPERAVLCYWCRRPGECYVHPLQPVCCGRHSCPGSARMLTDSATLWERGCQQISSGSTSQKQWPAEQNQNAISRCCDLHCHLYSSVSKENKFSSFQLYCGNGCHFYVCLWELNVCKYSQLRSSSL